MANNKMDYYLEELSKMCKEFKAKYSLEDLGYKEIINSKKELKRDKIKIINLVKNIELIITNMPMFTEIIVTSKKNNKTITEQYKVSLLEDRVLVYRTLKINDKYLCVTKDNIDDTYKVKKTNIVNSYFNLEDKKNPMDNLYEILENPKVRKITM